jgi:hypothetical protein
MMGVTLRHGVLQWTFGLGLFGWVLAAVFEQGRRQKVRRLKNHDPFDASHLVGYRTMWQRYRLGRKGADTWGVPFDRLIRDCALVVGAISTIVFLIALAVEELK